MGVSENVVYPFLPNGFADHYPVFKWLFHWEYTLFSDKPTFKLNMAYFSPTGHVTSFLNPPLKPNALCVHWQLHQRTEQVLAQRSKTMVKNNIACDS